MICYDAFSCHAFCVVVILCRELATLSVFVLSGPELKGTVVMDGPLAPLAVDTAEGLQSAINAYTDKEEETNSISFSEEVDFEHLKAEISEDDDEGEEDEDEEHIDEKDPDAADKRRKQRERRRERFMEAKKKRDEKRALMQKKIREDGEPFVKTFKAPRPGWYRVCVEATSYQVRWSCVVLVGRLSCTSIVQ
jgi:hypothetical protein